MKHIRHAALPGLMFCLAGLFLSPTAAHGDYLDRDYLFVLTAEYDYSAGNFSLMDLDSLPNHDNNLGPLHADAIARAHDGLIYVVNRFGADNIQVLDPGADFTTVLQFTTGSGSNPQDICFVSAERAFITRFDAAELWEVNPQTGEHSDSIDLGPLADGDGLPEMQSMAIEDGLLYVTLQRLDRDNYWLPEPPSYLALIDLETNTLLDADPAAPGMQGLPLAATNPKGAIVRDPLTGDFLIAEAGLYGEPDGGIERFDPWLQQSRGMAITEAVLGGDIDTWDTANGRQAFVVTLSPTWSTAVMACDLESGQALGTLITSQEYAYPHLLVDPTRRQVILADFSYTAPGIRAFHTDSHAPIVEGPIDVGLYPHWLLALHGPESSAPGDLMAAATNGLTAWPQPARYGVNLVCRNKLPGRVTLEILDVTGRHRATLIAGARLPQGFEIHWDGRDARGRALPAGLYLARLRGMDWAVVKRLQLLQ